MKLNATAARNQNGFTVLETIIAVAVSSILALVIGEGIGLMLKINKESTNNITAQRQVQQIGFYISRDVLMSQTVTRLNNNPAGSGFPLVLTWVDTSNNASYQITYGLNNGTITRTQVVGGSTTNISVANYISAISFTKTGNGYYNLSVTATAPGQNRISQSRTYQIMQRTA